MKLHVMIAMVVKVNLCTITSGGEYNSNNVWLSKMRISGR